MAIKHTTGFLPPTVKVPMDVSIGPQAARVVEGIQRKYGLRAILLRQLARFGDYHCVELELRGKGSRPLEAVWVGLEDYMRMGRGREGYDPLADWLREKQRGGIPAQRPPWERHGWFQQAEHWISYQLDRRNIQSTGSLTQSRVFSHAGTILRIPTSIGKLYFKASYHKAPKEVMLTRFLAQKWPGRTTDMLCGDDERNWMLMPDFAFDDQYDGSSENDSEVVTAMARIQVDSVDYFQELENLGCQVLGLAPLRGLLSNPALADEFPELEGSGLSEAERIELRALAPRLADSCDELEQLGLPETLVHPDFRVGNFFIGDEGVRFIDWQGSGIAHPFFCVMKLLRNNHPLAFESFKHHPVVRAYLTPFRVFASEERLLSAMVVASGLQHAWRLLRWSREFPWYEPGGPAMVNAQRYVTNVARQLLESHRRDVA